MPTFSRYFPAHFRRSVIAPRFLEQLKKVINDPAVEVEWNARDVRPGSAVARLDSDAFKFTDERLIHLAHLFSGDTGAPNVSSYYWEGCSVCVGLLDATLRRLISRRYSAAET